MEKLVFENKHCKIILDKDDKYYVVQKKEHPTISEYQSFKNKEITAHYGYEMKYDPELKWYFVVPVLLLLFILPMVWIDLLRNACEDMFFWRSFEVFSAIITFTSFAIFFFYLCIDKLFDVRFVSWILFVFTRRKRPGYMIITDKNQEGVEIVLESKEEEIRLIEALDLSNK